MSDIGGGGNERASNGSANTAGPGPVVRPSTSGNIRTPRDIMRDRLAREQAETARKAEEERRRRSAESRALGAGTSGAARDSGGSYRRSGGDPVGGVQPAQSAQSDPASGKTQLRTGQAQRPVPTERGYQEETQRSEAIPRTRGTSRSQQESRNVSQPTSDSQRVQQAPLGLRQASAPASTAQAAGEASSVPTQSARNGEGEANPVRGTASSFPHAFERWEQLSSHWEGLTSYWLHKLESNQEEIAKAIPSASAMSRQITDLSAAGANLFHAVVELQRLRASSERKFQRWFFETRAEQECAQESQGDTERILQVEREARAEAVSQRNKAEQARKNAEKMVNEMRRELNISKEEARRAWEELGRREQEERERTTSLREGMPTVVGGVQVVPMHTSAGISRQGSESQRPTTREDTQYQSSRGAPTSRQDPYDDQGYYEEGASPTDTDPFTETSQAGPALHHEPDIPSLAAGTYQPYPLGDTPATSGSTALTAIPPPQQRQPVQTAGTRLPTRGAPAVPPKDEPQSGDITPQPPFVTPMETLGSMAPQERTYFYQHPPGQTFLHSPTSGEVEDPLAARSQTQPQDPRDLRSEPSYVSSVTDETEYEIDSAGNLRRDAQGRPLIYRHPPGSRRAGTRSEESDDYDVEADIAREREHASRYGGSGGTSRVPATSAEAIAGHPATIHASATEVSGAEHQQASREYQSASVGSGPDYEGQGFEGWEALQTRHHHPTRLSDVMEEEDEARSRTTAEYPGH